MAEGAQAVQDWRLEATELCCCRVDVQGVVVAGQTVEMGLVDGDHGADIDIGGACRQIDLDRPCLASTLESGDIAELLNPAPERAADHAHADLAVGVHHLALRFDEGIAFAARVDGDQPRHHRHGACQWQRPQLFDLAFGINVEWSRRNRHCDPVDRCASATPADCKGREDCKARVSLIGEAQILDADAHRVQQHIALVVGDADRLAPGAGLAVGKEGFCVVGGHGVAAGCRQGCLA